MSGSSIPPQPPRWSLGKIVGVGCAALLCLFIAVPVIIGIIVESVAPGSLDKLENSTAATRAKAPSPVEQPKIVTAPKSSTAEERRDAARGVYREMMATSQECSTAFRRVKSEVATAMNAGDEVLLELFDATRAAKDKCRAASIGYDRITVPAVLPEESRRYFTEAKESCSLTDVAKQMMADKLSAYVDGDRRPSILAEARDHGEAANAGTLKCGMEMVAALEAAGVDLKEIKALSAPTE